MSFDPNSHSASQAASSSDRPTRDLSVSSSASVGSRRGLTPLSTQVQSAARQPDRHNSPFSPPSHSAHPSYSVPSTSRSRTLTSSSNTAPFASQSGFSSRLSRASPSISSSLTSPTASVGSGAPGAGQSGNNLAKIVIAQIFLLLSTIKEDNFAEKLEQIRSLVDSSGMDVYTKYFRRLLISNAAQVWGSGRSSDMNGSYQVLADEIQKVTRESDQAAKIAESIESGDGDIFKDFDLSTLMEHFKMSPTAKVTLASAFKRASKPDLRTKADAILSNNLQTFIVALSRAPQTSPQAEDLPTDLIAKVIDRLAQSPPRNWTSEHLNQLRHAVQGRYSAQGLVVPLEVNSALFMFSVMASNANHLIKIIQRQGSRMTDGEDVCRNTVDGISPQHITPSEVANALLFMVLAADEPRYNPSVFVTALRDHPTGHNLDWQEVVKSFDRENLRITRSQFKTLFDALMIPAQASESFDIQPLWGGNLGNQADDWHNLQTLLTFTSAFLSFSEDELDASQIPRLRHAFSIEEFEDGSAEVKAYAAKAVRHPFVSLDAAYAMLNLVFRSSETYNQAQALGIIENIINPKMDLFVCSVAAVPKPWAPLQDQAMKQLMLPLFQRQVATHEFVFHLLWKRDQAWLSDRLVDMYNRNNNALEIVYDHAARHGWLETLVDQMTELSLDLAALAHGRGQFEILNWLQDLSKRGLPTPRLRFVLTNFLKSRADDEMMVLKENAQPRHVSLNIKTVHAILKFLGESDLEDESSVPFQRLCISAYPRLINYGEGFDEIIDANSRDGNALGGDADARMQEHYKDMYSSVSEVRDVVEALQRYKTSEDSGEQDLFACMIYGLFDEYNCFGEYPLDALATTAVLFGSIINFDLLSVIAQKTALGMVLEAVRDYSPEESMFKFGLQALLHFSDQLLNWRAFTQALAQVPHLQGSQIWPQIERVLQEDKDLETDGEGQQEGVEQASVPELPPTEAKTTSFACLHVEQSIAQDLFEEPDEQVQESVLFVLNNTTDTNLASKMTELRPKLKSEHIQWFAHFLVDQRIKSQPNFQPMYMDLLESFNSKELWAEILRETYVCAFRMLNAESTMTSSTERALLKNIAVWLGSLTLARNKPIMFRNISFKDLLIEAHDTQRLPVAIPFTCNVLTAAAKSIVFKPPSSWTMEILQILAELYDFAGLKLQLKFEIEILYKALGVEDKEIERSDAIRSRPPAEEDVLSHTMTDLHGDGFGEMSFNNFARRDVADRLSPSTMPELSDLTSVLRHNYTLGNTTAAMQNKIRQMLTQCAERAVAEIVGPVVERSVTIAAISTTQLVSKDFVLERDETKFQQAAHGLVRSLAARLALVTCKEPLRQALIANVRQSVGNLPDPNLLQDTTIIMFVNDNIEAVCSIIEKAAENASIQEIDLQIEEALRSRREGTYQEPSPNRWSFFVPDPYRLSQGGLNREQLAIYEDFDRLARGSSSHANTLSQDSVRQLPDVLQDQYAGIPSMSTPADVPSLPRQNTHQSQTQVLPTSTPQHLVNGYGETQSLSERVSDLVASIQRIAQEASRDGIANDFTMAELVRPTFLQLQGAIRQGGPPVQQDQLAWIATGEVWRFIYEETQPQTVVDVLARVIAELSRLSDSTSQAFYQLLQSEPDRLFNASAAAGFVKSGIIDVKRIDNLCAAAIRERGQPALEYFSQVIDLLLLNEPPTCMRSDFSHSITALWEADPEVSVAGEITRKLESTDVLPSLDDPAVTKEYQIRYALDEWSHLLNNDASESAIAFYVHSMQQKNVLATREDTVSFFWHCIDIAVMEFEREAFQTPQNVEAAYVRTDALAKLIVSVVIWHGAANGGVKQSKADLFYKILSTVSLVMVHHFKVRGERYNGKVFFRLFSVTLCELADASHLVEPYYDELVTSFGRALKLILPREFPFFAFHWVSLVSHRLLMPVLIRSSDENGPKIYVDLVVSLLDYVSELLKPYDVSVPARDMYRGAMKLLLVLHHDFPQLLVENHFRLVDAVALHATQLRNLIVSAVPPNLPQGQDPFMEGDRADSKRVPVIHGDLSGPLVEAGVKTAVDELLETGAMNEQHLDVLVHAICNPLRPTTGIGFVPVAVNTLLVNALVLYILAHGGAMQPVGFSPSSPQGAILSALAERLEPEARFYLFNAMLSQLRYPNSHTLFFKDAICHLFGAGKTDALSQENQQLIARAFLERLVTSRPHPWGLIVAMLELLKNPIYHFWELPCIKSAPEVEQLFIQLYQQMNQGQRAMA